MTTFAEELTIQQIRKNGNVNTLVSGHVFDGNMKGFQKKHGEKIKYSAIPDAHNLFLVKPEKKNLAGRLRRLLAGPGSTCKGRRNRRNVKASRRYRRKRRKHRTRRKRGRYTRKK